MSLHLAAAVLSPPALTWVTADEVVRRVHAARRRTSTATAPTRGGGRQQPGQQCLRRSGPCAPRRSPRGRPPADRPLRTARDGGGRSCSRYDDMVPVPEMSGDLEALAAHAGQSAGIVHDIIPAADIVVDASPGTGARQR